MATVNQFFQSGRTIGRRSEQDLYEDLIIESMKIYGFEVYYIPRTEFNEDKVLTEDYLNSYENAYPIEMYMQNTSGFEGDGELLTKFGLEIRDSANFVVSRRRWNQIVASQGKTILQRPAEGDVVYFPLTKSFFEIRKTEAQTPFFQLGKLYVYTLQCELMQFSNERFNTGVSEIDTFVDSITNTTDNYEFLLETGDTLILEEFDVNPLVLESYTTENEKYDIENDLFDREALDVLDFSESNPFGEVYR